MSEREPFAYALLRVIPDAERGESLNVGIVLYCRGRGYLAARTAVPVARLEALSAEVDLEALGDQLRALELVARGDPEGGVVAAGPASARFHWLVSPTSTIVQASEVHTGLCVDPAETIERLYQQLVL